MSSTIASPLPVSYYGLPDIGFITWAGIVDFARRINTLMPRHNLFADIDDDYREPGAACHVVSQLEAPGAAGVALEDQKRPRRCGHFDGKQIIDLDEYIARLDVVLATRRDPRFT